MANKLTYAHVFILILAAALMMKSMINVNPLDLFFGGLAFIFGVLFEIDNEMSKP